MPKMSNVQLFFKNEQPTLFIRVRTAVQDLPRHIGESYAKMGAYLQEQGECLSHVPYVAYHNMDMQDLDVEIGFPVAKPIAEKGEIKAGCIPAGKRVVCMYRGAYTGLEPIYAEMMEWIMKNGFDPVGTAYEHYYNGLEFPESELLTEVVMPLQ